MQFGNLNPVFSAYPQFAGQTLEWLTSDTEDIFKQNLKDRNRKQTLIDDGWMDRGIEYRINSYGFRCEEFTDNNAIVFLGCSHTVGIGVREEDTFPHLISKELGLKNYNLGCGGGSNDSAFRIGHYWIPKLKPKMVIIISPQDHRVEMIESNNGAFNILPGFIPQPYAQFYNTWIANNHNCELNRLKNKLALKYLSEVSGSQFVFTTTDDVINPTGKLGFARDLMHFGKKSNEKTAELILELINKVN